MRDMLKTALNTISNAFCKKLTMPSSDTQETEEYFQEQTTAGGAGMANSSAVHGDITDEAGGASRFVTSENMMMSSSEHAASSGARGADSTVIVDSKFVMILFRTVWCHVIIFKVIFLL